MRKAQDKPRGRELKKIYKGLLSNSVTARIETLKKVLQWYDQALCYLEGRKSFASRTSEIEYQRLKVAAADCRLRSLKMVGDSSEKEVCFAASIGAVEQLCRKSLRPYSIEKAMKESAVWQSSHVTQVDKIQARNRKVLEVLRGLDPVNVTGNQVSIQVMNGRGAVSITPGKVEYGSQVLRDLRHILREQGKLGLIVKCLSDISRASAMQKNGQGGFEVVHEQQVLAIVRMLRVFVSEKGGKNA